MSMAHKYTVSEIEALMHDHPNMRLEPDGSVNLNLEGDTMENQHRLIKGYRELSPKEIDNMNLLKALEVEVLMLMANIAKTQQVTGRWMAIARTHIEQGFMAAGRAVARPEGYLEPKPLISGDGKQNTEETPTPTEPDRAHVPTSKVG